MKLYEFVSKLEGEYIFVIAKSTKKAVKLANLNSDLCEPDYDAADIINDELEVDSCNEEGLYEKIIAN